MYWSLNWFVLLVVLSLSLFLSRSSPPSFFFGGVGWGVGGGSKLGYA